MSVLNVRLLNQLTNSPSLAVCGGRFYAGSNEPPTGYLPAAGPCIVFNVRSEVAIEGESTVNGSMQFKCYGLTAQIAGDTYTALKSALHHQVGNVVRYATLESGGTSLTEMTGWHYVIAWFYVVTC